MEEIICFLTGVWNMKIPYLDYSELLNLGEL
jgi:hypothetical protein